MWIWKKPVWKAKFVYKVKNWRILLSNLVTKRRMLDFYKWMFDIFGFLDVWAGGVLFG